MGSHQTEAFFRSLFSPGETVFSIFDFYRRLLGNEIEEIAEESICQGFEVPQELSNPPGFHR